MSTEIELILRISAYIFGVAGGVYALRRSVDNVSTTLEYTNKTIKTLREEIDSLKLCDEELKRNAIQVQSMMEYNKEFRNNVDKVQSEVFRRLNNLNERVKACETCSTFLRDDLENLKRDRR